MLELVKKNIHMNRWKTQVDTQVTLDDDFIVPDTMSDIAQVILDSGEVQLEPARVQSEKVTVRGKLDFHVLYRKEEGGLQTLGGLIPFEETVNVPAGGTGLCECFLENGGFKRRNYQFQKAEYSGCSDAGGTGGGAV